MEKQIAEMEQLAKQNSNLIHQLSKDEGILEKTISNINSRLDDLQSDISNIRVELETFKVKHNFISENCKDHVKTLLTHESSMHEISTRLINLDRDILNNTEANRKFDERLSNMYKKFDRIANDLDGIKEAIASGKNTLKVVEKIALAVIGGLGLLLTIQQIFFGNWHF